jgi:hypothetical protein
MTSIHLGYRPEPVEPRVFLVQGHFVCFEVRGQAQGALGHGFWILQGRQHISEPFSNIFEALSDSCVPF